MFDFLTHIPAPPICSVEGCEKESIYNHLCADHRKLLRKEIKEQKEKEKRKTKLEKIFETATVKENSCIVPLYNRVTIQGVRFKTYRFVYERVTGDFLTGDFHIHHTCFNNECINPRHMKKLTVAEHNRTHGIIRHPTNGRIIGIEYHSH